MLSQSTRSSFGSANNTLRHWRGSCVQSSISCARCGFAAPPRWHSKFIHNGVTPDVLEVLSARGYIKDFAGDRNVLRNALSKRSVGFYAGIDPTAPSLHLGHLLPLMVLFWVYMHGHYPISLIGGATAQIGDPSGRLVSRTKTAQTTHTTNKQALTSQVGSLWKNAVAYGLRHGYETTNDHRRELLDNSDWLQRLNVIDFLRSLGSSMRIGAMLGRDTVKNKMEKGDGMSFAEFSYPLLQAWDWWHMYQNHGVQVQVGGSDQFGNIVAGLESVKAIAQSIETDTKASWADQNGNIREDFTPMGLTTPLLTTSSGEKFGKSAGNAIWLDSNMTSPFDLYGFLLRTADADVERYLKLFTFVPLNEIAATIEQHSVDPGARIAQHLLASEVVELVHGREEVEKTKYSHETLRGGTSTDSSERSALASAETVSLPRSLLAKDSFARTLFHAGLVATKSEGARLIKGGGAYVASTYDPANPSMALSFVPMKDLRPDACVSFTTNSMLIVRLGKWKVRVVQAVEDESFDQDGLDAPGWQEWKAERSAAAG